MSTNASAIAASQAAIVRLKITRICPPQSLWKRPQAMRLTETPCSIISADRNMTIMFRRHKNPTSPMPNNSAPIKSELKSSAVSFMNGLPSRSRDSRRPSVASSSASDFRFTPLDLGALGHRDRADEGHEQQCAGDFDGNEILAEEFRSQMRNVLFGQNVL